MGKTPRLYHIDLFSGIGCFSYAARQVWGDAHRVACFCESDPFCRRVIEKHFPSVPIVEDVNEVDKIVNLCYPEITTYLEANMGKLLKDYSGAVEMYEAGSSIQECADYYNVKRQAMWMILRRRGVQFRTNSRYGEENHFHRGGGVEFSDRKRCMHIVEKAIKSGKITPEPCEKCGVNGIMEDGRREVQAHHDDYNYPLRVRWLCQTHHHEWHKSNTPIALNAPLPTMKQEEIASMGGKNSWKNMTPEQRAERSKKMLDARWPKEKRVEAARKGIDLLTGGFP